MRFVDLFGKSAPPTATLQDVRQLAPHILKGMDVLYALRHMGAPFPWSVDALWAGLEALPPDSRYDDVRLFYDKGLDAEGTLGNARPPNYREMWPEDMRRTAGPTWRLVVPMTKFPLNYEIPNGFQPADLRVAISLMMAMHDRHIRPWDADTFAVSTLNGKRAWFEESGKPTYVRPDSHYSGPKRHDNRPLPLLLELTPQ